jgi:hypothetical protein
VATIARGIAADCSDEEFYMLMEETTPIAEQVSSRLNLQ